MDGVRVALVGTRKEEQIAKMVANLQGALESMSAHDYVPFLRPRRPVQQPPRLLVDLWPTVTRHQGKRECERRKRQRGK